MLEKLKKIKCFLFDMDGTIYLGNTLFPSTKTTLSKLETLEKKYYFLTNNSSKNQKYYKIKLDNMGISVQESDIFNSTDSIIYYLKEKKCKNIFLLGTDELRQSLIENNFHVVNGKNEAIDYVVVGFDLTLNYETLSTACQYIDQGIPYVATHPDVRCPLEGKLYIPDCGSFIALIKEATGKECEVITGKPSKYMLDVVLEKTGFEKEEIAMVGDRLYTDIAFGKNSGILSVLLLSGEATEDDVKKSNVKPDLIFNDIGHLGEFL